MPTLQRKFGDVHAEKFCAAENQNSKRTMRFFSSRRGSPGQECGARRGVDKLTSVHEKTLFLIIVGRNVGPRNCVNQGEVYSSALVNTAMRSCQMEPTALSAVIFRTRAISGAQLCSAAIEVATLRPTRAFARAGRTWSILVMANPIIGVDAVAVVRVINRHFFISILWRVFQLVFVERYDITAFVRVVLEQIPGNRIPIRANAQKSAELHHGVENLTR